jgi:HEAT repeat protein
MSAGRRTLALLAAALGSLAPGGARGQQPPAMSVKVSALSVKGGPGQASRTVSVEGSRLLAAACPSGPCRGGATEIPVPERFRAALAEAQLSSIELDGRRALARVIVPLASTGERWVALVAGPLGQGEPRVIFADVADPDGDPQAREPRMVQVLREGASTQVLVGSRDAEVGLCGRPAVLSPRVVDPGDLTLKSARVQRLPKAERDAARRVTATRREKARPAPLGRLLAVAGASSAIGSPAALADGDPETSWSENRGSDGRGEFVTFRAPREVPLVGVSLTIRPPTKAVPEGASPRHFYLADDTGLVEVTLPEDAWLHPGAVYDVAFPEPRATSCLALVLEDSFSTGNAAVTIAEVEARSALDDRDDLGGIVALLGAGGRDAALARAVLMRGGPAARQALMSSYPTLDDAARMSALDALDQGPCEEAAGIYVSTLSSRFDAEARHGRTRIERCRKGAVPALVAAVGDPKNPSRVQAADELSVLSPADAVGVLVRSLEPGPGRKKLRFALARAVSSPRALPAVIALLDDPKTDPRLSLDVLRGAGPLAGSPELLPHASAALGRAAGPGAPFELRYLALAPEASLAAGGHAPSLAQLDAALSAPEPAIRAAAARAAGPLASLRSRVLALAADPEPRVREAVALALGALPPGADADRSGALRGLLGDEWTFVRMAAADALAALGPDPASDAALVAALGSDRSPLSLPRIIEALARRRVLAAGDRLRALADSEKQAPDVRIRAVKALGAVCHRASIDRLTELAQAGAKPFADGAAQSLGGVAVSALGRLHPPDLATRLAPLRGEGASKAASLAAQAALDETDRCP